MTSLQCPTTLILARHAEAEYEASEWEDEGGSLTALGRRQAAALGESLARRRVAHVWTSTLARAVQTGEIVAARLGVGVTTRLGLREFSVGEHRGVPLSVDPFVQTYLRWLDGELDVRVPGGETGREIADRFDAVLREVADTHPGETVLVVSHGGVLRLSVPSLCRMQVPPARLGNCATIEVGIDADDWVCRSWQTEPEPGQSQPGG